MVRTVAPARRLRGTLSPPGDKSISHRAAILNALAQGEVLVENFQRGADCLATLRCLDLLGVRWRWQGAEAVAIEGVGLDGLREPPAPLDCRNSGTTMRLLAGVLAGQPFFSVLTGDASLRSRPMGRIAGPLRAMGAQVWGRQGGQLAPLAISGRRPLRSLEHRLPVASAQVKSCLLLAGLYGDGDTTVQEPGPSRDHTERMLAAMGVRLERRDGLVRLSPPTGGLQPLSLRVPGDFSAAAFWLVAAACHPDAEVRLQGVGINPTRTGLLDALRLMGADISLQEQRTWGAEPVADIVVRSSRLRGIEVGGEMVPRLIDEVPLLALAGCFAEGETVIRDAAELRVKESDRLRATARELRRLGAQVEELPDGLRVRGGIRLRGCRVRSYGDHRLAMALAVAGLLASGETVIGNPDVVSVSYPNFWRDLERLASS
ncbi:MAG TPA: 3-phosphoshikimate 1-carboxyvinyltransferase [Dehalococcoidia bacterium]|nr:3-phosphoshikimate 1-carboxyvinyltransferase [Dehalococcoidia bacterium]